MSGYLWADNAIISNPNDAMALPRVRRRTGGKALVLTGGGAMGAFQVGALRRLYETGYRPDVICGVSVGAINGAKLAEGGNAVDELFTLWDRLADSTFLVTNEFAGPDELVRRLTGWLMARAGAASAAAALPPPIDSITVGASLDAMVRGVLGEATRHASFLHALGSVGESVPAGFRGLRELIRENINPERIRDSGIKLRVGTVDLESGSLWQATEPRLIDVPDEVKPDVIIRTWSSQLLREPDLSRDAEVRDVTRWIRIEDAVYASTIMPVYFPPLLARERELRDGSTYVSCGLPAEFVNFLAQIDNPDVAAAPAWRHFFDGGLADIAPIRTAMRMGCREITVVGVSPYHMGRWRFREPDGTDPLKTPAFQYFQGFLDTWGLNVARSDVMLALAANEFMGWMYRLHSMMPATLATAARLEFEAYARERRGVLNNLLGSTAWFGGSVPMDPVVTDSGLNRPFYDEGCIIRVVAPVEPLPLTATEFTNAAGIREARDIGARRMEHLLMQPAEMELSHPVPETRILTTAQGAALGVLSPGR